jgi:hypothetical protein
LAQPWLKQATSNYNNRRKKLKYFQPGALNPPGFFTPIFMANVTILYNASINLKKILFLSQGVEKKGN